MNNPIVLSLFDGLSCGRIVLDNLGIKPYAYYASEIDKYAIKVSKENYPDIKQLGNVENWREWDIPWEEIDLLIGGSPCQGFSFCGKQLLFDDPRSKLFFDYLDILNHIKSKNPDVKFMLENVKMKKQALDLITDFLGVEPIFINSRVVSAQNRQRYYWCNWDVSEPENREIYLEDILEKDAIGCILKDHGKFKWRKGKSTCLDANYWKGVDNHAQRTMVLIEDKELLEINKDDIRKFFPVECERLQGIPCNYTKAVSNSQAYKMIGNAWQCDTIYHIFKELFMSNDWKAKKKKVACDSYETPAHAVESLDKFLNVDNSDVWMDVCCGRGAILKEMKRLHPKLKVYGMDIRPTDQIKKDNELDFPMQGGRDFLNLNIDEIPEKKRPDWIIMNPPFVHSTEFIYGAWKLARKGVFFLQRIGVLESADRGEGLWKNVALKYVYLFSRRLNMFPEGLVPWNYKKVKNGKAAGSLAFYAWYHLEHGYSGDPMIKWILDRPHYEHDTRLRLPEDFDAAKDTIEHGKETHG